MDIVHLSALRMRSQRYVLMRAIKGNTASAPALTFSARAAHLSFAVAVAAAVAMAPAGADSRTSSRTFARVTTPCAWNSFLMGLHNSTAALTLRSSQCHNARQCWSANR